MHGAHVMLLTVCCSHAGIPLHILVMHILTSNRIGNVSWQARKAYQQALKCEPDDQSLQQACQRAHIAEAKMGEQRKHTFNFASSGSQQRKKARAGADAKQQKILSFDEQDEEQ